MAKVNISVTTQSDLSSTFLTVPGLSFAAHTSTNDYYAIESIYDALGKGPTTDVGKCYTTQNYSYEGNNKFNTYPNNRTTLNYTKENNSTDNWFYKKGGVSYDWPGSVCSNCTGYAYGRALHWIQYLNGKGINTGNAQAILNLCGGNPPAWASSARSYLKSKDSIRPGGFLIWHKAGPSNPQEGHVAFVESVKLSDKGVVEQVIVSESNFHAYPWNDIAGTKCNTTNQGFSIVSKNVGSSNPVAFSRSWGTFLGFIDLGLYDLIPDTLIAQHVPSVFAKINNTWEQLSHMFTKVGGVWYPIVSGFYKYGGKWIPFSEITQNMPDQFDTSDGLWEKLTIGKLSICTDGSNHTIPDDTWQPKTAMSNPTTNEPLEHYGPPLENKSSGHFLKAKHWEPLNG